MLDQVIDYARSLDSVSIYIFLFIIAYLENVIPPIPGDLPVAFVGTLIVINDISFTGCVVWSSFGSLLGFFTMYSFGRMLGKRLYFKNELDQSNNVVALFMKIFPPEQFEVVKSQFESYGYWLILCNRFLTGTRAIISLAAGMSKLNILYVHLSALLSAILWNILLVYGGYLLGTNWEMIGEYISTYGLIFTIVVVTILVVLILRALKRNQSQKSI